MALNLDRVARNRVASLQDRSPEIQVGPRRSTWAGVGKSSREREETTEALGQSGRLGLDNCLARSSPSVQRTPAQVHRI